MDANLLTVLSTFNEKDTCWSMVNVRKRRLPGVTTHLCQGPGTDGTGLDQVYSSHYCG